MELIETCFLRSVVIYHKSVTLDGSTEACATEVAGVTFSDSDSAPAPKFLNPGPAILQI